MAYIEESLSDGEEVFARFRLHWLAWLRFVLWLAVGPIVFGVIGWISGPITLGTTWLLISLGTVGIAWLIAGYEYLRLKCIEQGVTNKRVILKRAIITRSTEEMKLTSIETVEIEQGLLGRILGFGTIKLTGRGVSDFPFQRVNDPMQVKKAIEGVSNPVS